MWVSSSPNIIAKDEKSDLECVFSGWPLPAIVYWYKDQEPISNGTHALSTYGTKGIYQSQEKKWKNGKETLRSILHLPSGNEEQEGFYTCSATNSIHGWSSSASRVVQMIFECKLLFLLPLSKQEALFVLEAELEND